MQATVLTKEILASYGFKRIEQKTKDRVTVMAKGSFELRVVDDGSVLYSPAGLNLLVSDLEALKTLYKKIMREELAADSAS